jgi:dihydrofolate synthase / folylpolyglutamate synthase
MTSYATAVSQLFALGHELATPAGAPLRKFDIAHMQTLVAALGHPERRFPSVLIAGTNGKGSTSATLASILRTAGYRVGLYSSPHLIHVNERIQISGVPISDTDFTSTYARVDDVAQGLVAKGELKMHPSFFEMMTAMAFAYFAESNIDIAVLEVGMGGRLDATNVVEPLLSVITDIALDHQQFLGSTIAEIAKEKAGIIHEGGLLVTLPQHPEANDVIGKVAMERNARAVSAADYVPDITPAHRSRSTREGNQYNLKVMGEDVAIESPLLGRHQLRNVALAIAAAEQLNHLGFKITAQQISEGVRQTSWPGRFQLIPGQPDFILDVAHNPAGAWALRSALSDRCEGRPLTIIFGAMRDKAISEMAELLFPLADHVILTQAHTARAASAEEIRDAALHTVEKPIIANTVPLAIERARAVTPENGVVVITGSIYIVGEALSILNPRA